MKKRYGRITKMRFMFLLATFLVTVAAVATPATADSYLGEFCWSISFTQNETGSIAPVNSFARMGVATMGGNYFTLQGIVSTADDPVAASGGATLSGSQVFVTLAYSQDQSASRSHRNAGTVRMTLNTLSLGGTIFIILNEFDLTGHAFSSGYRAGTATFTACP